MEAKSQTVDIIEKKEKLTNAEFIYAFIEEAAKVRKDKMWGYINMNGEITIPLRFEDATSFLYGKARVQRGPKFAYIDSRGRLLTPWFDYAYPYYNGLAKVKNREKEAFVNEKGQVVSDWFDISFPYYYGLTRVKKDHKWAFMDSKGKVVTEWYYHPDTLHVKVKLLRRGNNVVFLNEKREDITPEFPDFFWTSKLGDRNALDSLLFDQKKAGIDNGFYTENLMMVKDTSKGFAYRDDAGDIVTDWFAAGENYYEGVARVVNKKGEMAFIGANAEKITPWCKRVHPFYNRLAIIEKDNKYAFIDKIGTQVTPWYDYASQFSDGVAKVSLNKKWGYIDSKGNEVLPLIYSDATSFSYGYARVELDSQIVTINKKGKVMTGPFKYVTRFTDSLAAIKVENKYTYIDRNGTQVTPWLDYASEFTFGFARAGLNGKIALINNQGKLITPWYEKAYLVPPYIMLGDTLLNGKLGRYIYFPLRGYNDFFNKYPSNMNYDNYSKIAWNYTDREPPLNWNHGFYKDGLEVLYKPHSEKKFGKNNYEAAALADYDFKPISEWYDSIYKSDDEIIVAYKKDKAVLLDIYGDEISDKFNKISYFKHEILFVELDEKFAFITTKGKYITPWYNQIDEYKDGFAIVKLEEKYALMNENFQIETSWYDYVENDFVHGITRIKNEEMWGGVNRIGNEVAAPKYESASFIDGFIKVKKEGIYYYFDNKGNLIKESNN